MKLDNMPNWLRWILVLPATLVIYTLTYSLFRLCLVLTGGMWAEPSSIFGMLWDLLFTNILAVYAGIYIGTHIAPSKKKPTCIVLTCLFVALGVFMAVVQMFSPDEFTPAWKMYGDSVFIALAAIGTCIHLTSKMDVEISN